MARRHRDPLTKDLFEWQPSQVAVGYSDDVTGRGRLEPQSDEGLAGPVAGPIVLEVI